MNKGLLRVLKITAACFVALMILSQLYKTLYNPFTTETVRSAEYYSGIDVVGLILRDETVITAQTDGIVSFPHGEGNHVSKNGVAANIFSSKEAAAAYLKVRELEEEIATLKDIQTYNDLYAADMDLLDTKVLSALVATLGDQSMRLKNTNVASERDLCNYLNRKQIVMGQVDNFNALIASLEAEKAAYEAQYTGAVGSITTDQSGYFISVVDGYENAVSPDNFDSLTPSAFENLKPSEPAPDALCKIVSDYHWYLACEIGVDESLSMKTGSTVKLRTAVDGYTELPVTVVAVNRDTEKRKAVVVFRCKILGAELAGLRNLPVTIVKENYQGLRVDNRALRAVDGVRGVFVYRNRTLKFVPVNILYTGSYSIIEKEIGKEDTLRLYDEIVVKGRNLYDGKLVN